MNRYEQHLVQHPPPEPTIDEDAQEDRTHGWNVASELGNVALQRAIDDHVSGRARPHPHAAERFLRLLREAKRRASRAVP